MNKFLFGYFCSYDDPRIIKYFYDFCPLLKNIKIMDIPSKFLVCDLVSILLVFWLKKCVPNMYWGLRIESGTQPLLKHACGEVTGCHAGCQEVIRCRTSGQSEGSYIMYTWIRLPTLALKPGRDVTRSPNEGFQWPHKKNLFPPIIFKKMRTEGAKLRKR